MKWEETGEGRSGVKKEERDRRRKKGWEEIGEELMEVRWRERRRSVRKGEESGGGSSGGKK